MLVLINADRLPGQPVCTPGMLRQAVSGRSPVDSDWWAELENLAVVIARDTQANLIGAISYAFRPRDDTGVVLWLHALERRTVVDALLQHALGALGPLPAVDAFDFATALGLGLEALPVRQRPVTHASLLEHGFEGDNLWRYMRRELPANLPTTSEVDLEPSQHKDGWEIRVRRDDQVVAEAHVGKPVDGIGVLWWIAVEPPYRGSGLGGRLLGTACDVLTNAGAREVVLYVDDDDPRGERSREAANRLYDAAGFVEIDRLYSYRLRR